MQISKEVEKGQSIYSRSVLSIYDLWVLGISNSYIWKCPTKNLISHYNQNITSNHLDIGVGTGYFLDKCQFPKPNPRIALMDLNQNTLDKTSQRISRYQTEQYQVNILEKITNQIKPFDSIALNYLLHCLPGNLTKKSIIFDNIKHLLNKDGTIFGSTILSTGVTRGKTAIKLMSFYNKKGIFTNAQDSYQDLEQCLSSRYQNYQIKTIGCVALFTAKNAK